MRAASLVALDIGATKIACAVGRPCDPGPGFDLLGTSLLPFPALPDGSWSDPVVVGQVIEQALAAARVEEPPTEVLVGVAHPSATAERVQAAVPLADEPRTVRLRDLERLTESAVAQALATDREAVAVERLGVSGNGFAAVRNPVGLSATRLTGEFLVVTLPTAVRQAVVQAVEFAGLDVAQLTHTLEALWAALPVDWQRRRSLLLVEVGGRSTTAGLVVDGRWSAARTVSWGGVTIAEAIARELGVTPGQAAAWSLEGMGGQRAEVRSIIERHWQALREALPAVLEGQPAPEMTLVGGRGALMDGFTEWLEGITATRTAWARSERTKSLSDLSQQLGLAAAIGLVELATRRAPHAVPSSPRCLNRLLDRTRTLLTEYF